MKFGSKEHMDFLEKNVSEPLREQIKEMEEEIKISGEWLNYRISQGHEDVGVLCERERVKFYRAKKIFKSILSKYKEYGKSLLEFESFFYGYCYGAGYDQETFDCLIYFKEENKL